jgi:hypothetical protein
MTTIPNYKLWLSDIEKAGGLKLGDQVVPVEVIQYDRVTRAVMSSRGGGLERARDKGHLDGGRGAPRVQRLYETGVIYGKAYEIHEGLTSSSGGGSGGHGPKGPQIRLAEAGEMLKIMRDGVSPRERAVLDRVCGEGMTLRQAATAARAGFPATTRALRNGLRIAMENWKAARETKTAGVTAARVKKAHRVISKIRL